MGAQPEVLDFPSSKPPDERKMRFSRLTCADLAGGDYRVEYLIEGALVAGQPMIVFGPPKTLKTSLIVDAAISLATASPFLGRHKVVRAARVALMSGESGLATLQEAARRVAALKGLELEAITGLIWSGDVPRLASVEHREALREFLVGDEIEVLIVDPAYLAMPSADAGNLLAQGELLRSVSQLCRDVGVTLCLVHHSRKNGETKPGEPLLLCDVAWAGFAEFARQFWTVNRRVDYQHGSGLRRLWLTVGGSAGHSACWGLDVAEGARSADKGRDWQLTIRGEQEARQHDKSRRETGSKKVRAAASTKRQTDRQQRGVDAIRESGEPLTKSRIAEALSTDKGTAAKLISGLVDEGSLVATTVTYPTNGRSYTDYQLVETKVDE